MKYLLSIALATVAPILATATMPFPTKTVSSSSGQVNAQLLPNMKEVLVVVVSNSPTLRFSFEDLPIPMEERCDRVHYTTAGLTWYRNSIAFFDQSERHLIVRLSWGKYLVLELEKAVLTYGLTEALENEANQKAKAEASALLLSRDRWDRQTGAIHAGQLRIEEVIPRLKELLKDESTYSEISTRERVVYFVREAAKNALVQMGIDPGSVTIEYYPATVTRWSSKTRSSITVTNSEEALKAYMEEVWKEIDRSNKQIHPIAGKPGSG